ncbi:hypothetical protein D3C72_2268330 [compost metagenome]
MWCEISTGASPAAPTAKASSKAAKILSPSSRMWLAYKPPYSRSTLATAISSSSVAGMAAG